MASYHGLRRGLSVVLCASVGLIIFPPDGKAQERVVEGTVVNASTNQPIAAAEVRIADTEIATLTNETGRFRLQVPATAPDPVRLRVTRIGFRGTTEEVSIGTRDLRISMAETAITLDQIVVTGTVGETLRRSLGHSMASVSASEVLENMAVPDLGRLIDGRAAGVVVLHGTGITGSGPRINIRGTSSLSLSGEPLIYVDGIRVNNEIATGPTVQDFGSGVISRLNDINPEDIESIEIIKGPAAATLYGTEASNGVIQIITKRGLGGGRPVVNFRVRQGAQWLHNLANRVPTNFQRTAEGEVASLNLIQQRYADGNPPFQTGHLQGYGMTVRGGYSDVQYYAALSYDRDEGVDPTNVARRYSGRVNLALSPHSSLNVTANMGLATGRIDLSRDADIWFGMQFGMPSLLNTPNEGYLWAPPELIRRAFDDSQGYRRLTGGLTLQHTPAPWFSQRLIVGRDFTDEDNRTVVQRMDAELQQWYTGASVLGNKSRNHRTISVATVDYSATFTFPFTSDLTSATSVGTQYYKRRADILSASGREFPARGIDVLSAAGITFGLDDFVENTTLGFYLQEQLSWRNRIFLTGAVRGDDNSAFGEDFEFVLYPKVGAAWVLSEEEFWDFDFVDAIRLRAAYGRSGQQPEDFAALRAYRPISTGDGGSAVSPRFIGNPDLAPERGTETEIGFEAGLFNERVAVDFTYYNQHTKDAIIRREMAPSSGFSGAQFVNLGEIQNRGLEVMLTTRVLDTRRVGWDVNLNLAWNDGKVLDVGGEEAIGLGGGSGGGIIRHQVGFPPGSWFGRKVVSAELGPDGIASNVMCDGGPDVSHQPVPCDDAPLVFFGSPTPRYEGSISSGVRILDNLRLHAMVDFKTGFYGFDFTNFHRCSSYRLCLELVDPTAAESPERVAMFQDPGLAVNAAMQNQSFARLREVSLNYSLPASWLRGTAAQRAVVMLSARNIHTWTNWTGLDPEASYLSYEADRLHGRYEWLMTPQPLQVVTTIRFTL